jgi:2-succinyl-6-hydroxy-2,4-cyclohexadiene-1-carboxylate synthase
MSLLRVGRDGLGPPLVWLHGFTQTRDSAHRFRSILAGAHEVATLDLPGHGEAHGVTTDLWGAAEMVADVLGPDPVDLGGYSLGARVALHVALAHPERVRRLVLLGATRGIADAAERAERRARDEVLAARLEAIGTEAFLDEWLAQEMLSDLPVDPVERAARSADAAGLASALRTMGTGTQEFLGPRLGEVVAPVLALAGARDPKFLAEAEALAAAVREGTYSSVAEARHAAHLVAPEGAAQFVERFLA